MKEHADTKVDSSSVDSRRRLIAALAAGGPAVAVAQSDWVRPALKSVVLPTHAQMSVGDAALDIDLWYTSLYTLGNANVSYSISLSVHIGNEMCRYSETGSNSVTMNAFSGGVALGSCTNVISANEPRSWSCCFNGSSSSGLSMNTSLTLNLAFDNGCSARIVAPWSYYDNSSEDNYCYDGSPGSSSYPGCPADDVEVPDEP